MTTKIASSIPSIILLWFSLIIPVVFFLRTWSRQNRTAWLRWLLRTPDSLKQKQTWCKTGKFWKRGKSVMLAEHPRFVTWIANENMSSVLINLADEIGVTFSRSIFTSRLSLIEPWNLSGPESWETCWHSTNLSRQSSMIFRLKCQGLVYFWITQKICLTSAEFFFLLQLWTV